MPEDERDCLERMALTEPNGIRERLHAALLRAALAETRAAKPDSEAVSASSVSA